jgi:hypothetical protein
MFEVHNADIVLSDFLDDFDDFGQIQLNRIENRLFLSFVLPEGNLHFFLIEFLPHRLGNSDHHNELRLPRVKELQLILHVEQPILADHIERLVVPAEDVKFRSIYVHLYLVLTLQLFDLFLVDLVEDCPSIVVRSQIHRVLLREAGRTVVEDAATFPLLFLCFLGLVLQLPLPLEVVLLVLLVEGSDEFEVVDAGLFERVDHHFEVLFAVDSDLFAEVVLPR